ncbi:PIN-like domain-containing protein [Schumannella luteola]
MLHRSRHRVPSRAGRALTTMDERYGPTRSQRVTDVEWITEATNRGEVLICKDRAIAKRPLEAEAIRHNAARVLVIASAQLTSSEMLRRLLDNESAIGRAARNPGPFVLGVDVAKLHRIQLR